MLNARRHRSGNYLPRKSRSARARSWCSTPEGIGAGITAGRLVTFSGRPFRCSTPEGIGAGITGLIDTDGHVHNCAQRPKASERDLPAPSPRMRVSADRVLNARRHRSGNYGAGAYRGHLASLGAQRPKASERELHQYGSLHTILWIPMLNARRHRSGNYWSRCQAIVEHALCSTPEGIGAGITSVLTSPLTSAWPSAQRPKASERELHRIVNPAIRQTAVLNARRHRSGNYSRRCCSR